MLLSSFFPISSVLVWYLSRILIDKQGALTWVVIGLTRAGPTFLSRASVVKFDSIRMTFEARQGKIFPEGPCWQQLQTLVHSFFIPLRCKYFSNYSEKRVIRLFAFPWAYLTGSYTRNNTVSDICQSSRKPWPRIPSNYWLGTVTQSLRIWLLTGMRFSFSYPLLLGQFIWLQWSGLDPGWRSSCVLVSSFFFSDTLFWSALGINSAGQFVSDGFRMLCAWMNGFPFHGAFTCVVSCRQPVYFCTAYA